MIPSHKSNQIKIPSSLQNEIFAVLFITLLIFTVNIIFLWLNPSSPSIFLDELLYKQNAESIFNLNKYITPHYPPIYSLALAPAFILKDWYHGMLLINTFLSSLLVPATWFLARTVKIQHPIIVAFITAVLPMQAIYPALIMSENLFVPLFVFAVALALRGGVRGNIECFVFGIVLFLAHFTKYLFLPALPLLLGIWLISRHQTLKTVMSGNISKYYFSILAVLLTYAGLTGLWIIYGLLSGFTLRQLFGFSYITYINNTPIETSSSLLMWGTAYASYIILAWLPFWGILAAWSILKCGAGWRKALASVQWRFMMLLLLFIIGYYLLATHHSFRALYNYPDPKSLLGRYLMHITPLVLVSALMLLEKLITTMEKYSFIRMALGAGIILLLSVFAWNVLFTQNVWNFPSWFTQISFNVVDIFSLSNKWIFTATILISLLPFFMTRFPKNIAIAPLYLVLALFLLIYISTTTKQNRPASHAQKLARIISTLISDSEKKVDVLLDLKHLPTSQIKFGLEFFGLPKNKFVIKRGSFAEAFRQQDSTVPILLLTRSKYQITPLQNYEHGDNSYRIYSLNNVTSRELAPIFLDYGPKKVVAGKPFLHQPCGNNAMWFKLKNFSSSTAISLDNHNLKLAHGNYDGRISAIIPPELTREPRNAVLKVYDSVLNNEGYSASLIIESVQ